MPQRTACHGTLALAVTSCCVVFNLSHLSYSLYFPVVHLLAHVGQEFLWFLGNVTWVYSGLPCGQWGAMEVSRKAMVGGYSAIGVSEIRKIISIFAVDILLIPLSATFPVQPPISAYDRPASEGVWRSVHR